MPTPYQPRDSHGGYAEQQLESNRFRVTFTGNRVTPRDIVDTYVLYRAAEITLASGNDHFVLVDRLTEADSLLVDPGPGFGFGFGLGSRSTNSFLFSSTPRTIEPDSFEAIVEIQVFPGEKPPGIPSAYDAREVIQAIGPRIVRLAPAR